MPVVSIEFPILDVTGLLIGRGPREGLPPAQAPAPFPSPALQVIRAPMLNKKIVRCVAYSEDGKTLASGSADATIKVWNVQTGKELKR